MQLVIVESPTKSKSLQKFLGKDFKVLASFGHVRDLPKSELGIEIENNFKPKYLTIPKARKVIKTLKENVQKTELTILAMDPDREGESIAWHLIQGLNLNDQKPYQRVVFHEITKEAIEKAFKDPRKVDMGLVDAQQARRILDRIVGYKLSPFLWKKIARGLSAGRVQSVAVRLVVEREKDIKSFVPQEYWTIVALLETKDQKSEFEALLIKKDNEAIKKLEIKTKKDAEKIVKDLKEAKYEVEDIKKKEVKRNPLPPFTTSTLQQEAWKRFHWPAKMTMRIAQNLYETGLITYHRSDSLNLSNLSLIEAEKFIIKEYGKNYWAGFQRKYKAKGRTQEAHEAIRPTNPHKTPSQISKIIESKTTFSKSSAIKLYELVWRRFVACQMAQAVFDSTAADILANPQKKQTLSTGKKSYTFRVAGQVLKFDGFLKVYPMKYEENELPPLKKKEDLKLIKLNPLQHFTQPLPRYTEATLIKALEENGIGRPSTYAPILFTIQERNYIEKNEKRQFQPTEIGTVVNDLLVKHFPEIVDIKFTEEMEEDLDKIAKGEKNWIKILKEFYDPFEKNLKQKYVEVSKKEFTEKPTEKICPKCKSPLLIRLGKFGRFYACSAFPKCKYTESLEKNTLGIKCPKCKKSDLVEKRTKTKKLFYGCSAFPKCDFALWDRPTGKKCPKCDSLLIKTKKGKIKCSNKECEFIELENQ
ncbi:type I DNA topoisomerase [Patescibacteria group bacterium]